MIKLIKNKRGVVTIYVAISLVTLLLFAALVIDVGMIALTKSRLQNVADASVLAAVQKPSSEAENEARIYAKENKMDIEIDKTLQALKPIIEEDVIVELPKAGLVTVTAWRNVHFFFARVINGNDFVRVSAKASAANSAINRINKGLRPIAVSIDSVKDALQQLMTLKEGAGASWKGNFNAVALESNPGGNEYRNTILNGSTQSHYIGEQISTETGNMVGPTNSINTLIANCTHIPKCTAASYAPDCPRLITIPVVDKLTVQGSSEKVTIVGFAVMFVEGVDNGQVTGTFIKMLPPGEIDMSEGQPVGDYWLKEVKLTD